MKLTTKGRYAVTAMLDLALHVHMGPVTLADIANRQHLSVSYLEQLFAKLRKNSLVKSVRGPGGGYQLGKQAEVITVASIIKAVDESVDATSCRGKENCKNHKRCLTHELWRNLSDQINGFLEGISLADLLHKSALEQGEDQDVNEVKVLSELASS
ncbi:MAG TPA: Fe-S cluster assembly transcriptional regulator IscR [Gammaproteobacteria bacterium]|nr:Fe-S cluster assembly transcriptional regulator IscR [Gammaproteobacteria bacterium]